MPSAHVVNKLVSIMRSIICLHSKYQAFQIYVSNILTGHTRYLKMNHRRDIQNTRTAERKSEQRTGSGNDKQARMKTEISKLAYAENSKDRASYSISTEVNNKNMMFLNAFPKALNELR